jgi:hypothetical protein
MKGRIAVACGMLAGLLVAAPVAAGPLYTGTTDLQGVSPTTGTTIWVEVSVHSAGPVVPYEFQIQNECTLPGHVRTVQRDDIVTWVYVDGGDPTTQMPVYLQAIPSGAKCKVFLTRGNVQLKGSVTSYSVG